MLRIARWLTAACLLLTIGVHAGGIQRPSANAVSPTTSQNGAEDTFRKTASKVVVLIARKSGEVHSMASAVILTADGYIGTNYHALQGADATEIRFFPNPNSSEDYQSFNGVRLFYADEAKDIAILKISSASLPFLECRSGCEAQIGQRVYAIGNPKGLSNTISDGIVSALRTIDHEDFVQHTAPISSGSSGGALVDADGFLLGMNTWQVANGQNLNFAIPAKHLLEALASARKTTIALSFPPESPGNRDATSIADRAWQAIFSKDYLQAINQAEQAVASGISNAQLYTTLGEGYLARGNEKTAEAYFRQAILIVGPDDEYKQTSRMELLRILGDRLNAQAGPVDRLAYIRLVDEFTRSTLGYWYRDHRMQSPSDLSLLGDPAGDLRVWVDPMTNADFHGKVRAWAVAISEPARSIVGKWRDKSGAESLFAFPTCSLEYNILRETTGKLTLRAVFQAPDKSVMCRADGAITSNSAGFTSEIRRMLGTSQADPIGLAEDTVQVEFRLLEDLKTIEGVAKLQSTRNPIGPLGKSMAELLQTFSKKTWKFTLVRD